MCLVSQGALNDEAIAALRKRIGIATPHPQPPWYREPGTDAFRHVAESYGDDNPLWCDPDYARASVWGESIAPPHLNGGDTLIGENEVARLDDATRALLKGDPLKGAHAYYAGSFREWWRPLRAGTRVTRRNALVGVHDKQSEFADRAVHEWTAEVFASASEVLSAQYRLMIRTDRNKVAAKEEKGEGKYSKTELRPYTADELARIDEAYSREPAQRRGAQPRWFEDVTEGDAIDGLVKGPLRVTDMVVWHTGQGMGLYGVKALRLGYQQRQRVPGFFRPDDLNVPDVQQRVHWDQEWARKAGNPSIYDYGRMRETWLIHLCTDWMGDDAWLAALDVEFRKFNYVGDTHWMKGTVTRKYLGDGGRPAVDLDVWGENQRGEITCPGHATILLPSREHGRVRLPDPPNGATTAAGALDALVDRFAAMEAR
ncbi:MAG: MaoC family dehydratase N-terminal domain-containing protein [Acidimicrobiia bacterium]